MQPTLYSNNILICNKAIRNYDCFKRNDIVIAIHPFNPTSFICKSKSCQVLKIHAIYHRPPFLGLIAMPGDIVLMNSTTVDDTKNSTTETIYIKPGSMWLEGDNRLNSTDSRNYGQVPMGLLKSKVMARVWPPSEFRIF